MSMKMGVGLAALIVAVVGAFIPAIGLFVGWIALVIACLAALMGDKGFTVATVIWSVIAFVFLTPSIWIEKGGAGLSGSSPILLTISIITVISPVACLILYGTGKLMLSKPAAKGK